MKKLLLLTGWLAAVMQIVVAQPTVPIPDNFFGINYFMPKYIGERDYGG
jgi:hypothetical protein